MTMLAGESSMTYRLPDTRKFDTTPKVIENKLLFIASNLFKRRHDCFEAFIPALLS